MSPSNEKGELGEWEQELFAGHRWGRLKKWFSKLPEGFDEQSLLTEHVRLRELWDKAKPLKGQYRDILKAIISLEICNWNLEESILGLCEAIGAKRAPKLPIGHNYSITNERWRMVWAYYLTLKKWLPSSRPVTGYDALLEICDPSGVVQSHILQLLGESSVLKQLYVQRFSLNFEFWLGRFPEGSSQSMAYNAAVEKLEKEILKFNFDSKILESMNLEGPNVWIEICHHKVFRRFDIIISSIGVGKWRAVMPYRGTNGIGLAKMLDKYLIPINQWVSRSKVGEVPDKALSREILKLLGKPNNEKVFLAALLASLLRSQQVAARERAKERLHSGQSP